MRIWFKSEILNEGSSDLPLCKKMCGSFGGHRGGGGGAAVAPALPLDRPPTRGMAVAATHKQQQSNHCFLDGIRDSPTRLKPPRSSTDTSPMAQKVLPFLNCTMYEHYHNFLFVLSSG